MISLTSRSAVIVLIAVTSFPSHSSAGVRVGVEVDEAEVKVLEGPDDDGDLEVAVRVLVKNTSEADAYVELTVQGTDREGFEIFEFRLSDGVKAGQARAFTDSDFIRERRYKSVVKWRVEEVTVRGGQPGIAAQPTAGATKSDRGQP